MLGVERAAGLGVILPTHQELKVRGEPGDFGDYLVGMAKYTWNYDMDMAQGHLDQFGNPSNPSTYLMSLLFDPSEQKLDISNQGLIGAANLEFVHVAGFVEAGVGAISRLRSGAQALNVLARNAEARSNSFGATIEEMAKAIDDQQAIHRNIPNLTILTLRAIRTELRNIAEHLDKMNRFRDNPTVRPGIENMPAEKIAEQQAKRINHLKTEIRTFRDNIMKILEGEL